MRLEQAKDVEQVFWNLTFCIAQCLAEVTFFQLRLRQRCLLLNIVFGLSALCGKADITVETPSSHSLRKRFSHHSDAAAQNFLDVDLLNIRYLCLFLLSWRFDRLVPGATFHGHVGVELIGAVSLVCMHSCTVRACYAVASCVHLPSPGATRFPKTIA